MTGEMTGDKGEMRVGRSRKSFAKRSCCCLPLCAAGLALSMLFYCDQSPAETVQLGYGQEQFLSAARQLQEPQGILPRDPFYECPEESAILFKDPSEGSEFFLADPYTTIALLSADPIYFARIDSELFYQRILRELDQIRRLYEGEEKSLTTQPFFKQVGNYDIELYFTPRELNYSLSSLSSYRYRLRQANSALRPRPDLWRLMEAAQHVELFYPQFEDEQMLEDFQEDVRLGKIRSINTGASTLLLAEQSDQPPGAKQPDQPAIPAADDRGDQAVASQSQIADLITIQSELYPFAYISGRQLEATDNLLDGESELFLQGDALAAIASDFLALFSLPPGNPRSPDPPLNTKDGIVIVIRGAVEPLQRELSYSSRYSSRHSSPSSSFREDNSAAAAADDPEIIKPWCHGAPPILRAPSGCLASLEGVYISELGDNADPNDYVELYNSNEECVDLGFIEAYIQRDFGCKIAEGNITGLHRLQAILPAGSYMAFGERGNSLGIREELAQSFSLDGSRYCIALTTRREPIRAHDDEQLADLAILGDAGDSGGEPLGIFSRGSSASRCLDGAGNWELERRQTPDQQNDCEQQNAQTPLLDRESQRAEAYP